VNFDRFEHKRASPAAQAPKSKNFGATLDRLADVTLQMCVADFMP
jgi:hypothetical protein